MKAIAIVVAAGRGSRAQSDHGPKQYAELSGQSVLMRAVTPFLVHERISQVQVVIHADDTDLYRAQLNASGIGMSGSEASRCLLAPVTGGSTRQNSVLAGLRAIRDLQPDVVLIHDAARPFVGRDDIDGVLDALNKCAGAVVAVPLVDTLKRAAGHPALITATVRRDALWRAQTPQGFRFADILAAHEKADADGHCDFTDDAAIAEEAGLEVALVEGSERNFKITTKVDFARARREIGMNLEFRNGTGFDVHAFTAGDHVWLCGVKVPHVASLKGHSDADVAMHALTDAIYGAIADGDIGAHFPPSDPQWKGASSDIFLAHARDRVAERGGMLVNVDVTILCELPKIGPHRDAMRSRLAEILGIERDRVAVKATTTEQLGFTGRGEGIAALASATVRLG